MFKTIKTQERQRRSRSDVSIINFEHVLHLFLYIVDFKHALSVCSKVSSS